MSSSRGPQPSPMSLRARRQEHGPTETAQASSLIVTGLAGIVFDGALDGDDAHQVHAHIHKRRQHSDPFPGITLKTLAQHGILVTLLPVGEDTLHDAGYPDRVVPAELSVDRASPDYACDLQFFQLLPCEVQILLRPPCDVFRRSIGLQTHVHHDLTHVIIHDGLQDLIFGIVVSNTGIGKAFKTDFGCQF